MSLREALLAMLVVSIGLACTAWFFATHERVTETVWVGFQGEARRNPWLAAERFLNRIEIPASELRTLPELRELAPGTTLVVPRLHHSISASLREALITWVNEGGYLIVEAEQTAHDDPLLDAFGVQRGASGGSGRKINIPSPNGTVYQEIRLPNAASPARLDLHSEASLQADEAWFRVNGPNGSSVLVLRVGDGMLAAVSDLSYLTNASIGALDHARFLRDLVQLNQFARETAGMRQITTHASGSAHASVMFFNRPAKLSLWNWLRTNAWAILGAGAFALVLWLWRTVPRFGPVAPDAPRARRSLLHHLRAGGHFLWSNGHSNRLLDASREACLKHVGKTLPRFRNASAEARLTLLAGVPGIREEHARWLIQPQSGGGMLQFLHTIRAYQQIHARLNAFESGLASGSGRT